MAGSVVRAVPIAVFIFCSVAACSHQQTGGASSALVADSLFANFFAITAAEREAVVNRVGNISLSDWTGVIKGINSKGIVINGSTIRIPEAATSFASLASKGIHGATPMSTVWRVAGLNLADADYAAFKHTLEWATWLPNVVQSPALGLVEDYDDDDDEYYEDELDRVFPEQGASSAAHEGSSAATGQPYKPRTARDNPYLNTSNDLADKWADANTEGYNSYNLGTGPSGAYWESSGASWITYSWDAVKKSFSCTQQAVWASVKSGPCPSDVSNAVQQGLAAGAARAQSTGTANSAASTSWSQVGVNVAATQQGGATQ